MIHEKAEVRARIPSGTSDPELVNKFTSGLVPRGTRLYVESPLIEPTEESKGAEVILITSAAYITGGAPRFEHLVLSNDPRVKDMRLKGLTHWKVVGKESEAELDRKLEEIAQERDSLKPND